MHGDQDDIERKHENSIYFPNLTAVAYFVPTSQNIYLHDVTRQEILDRVQAEDITEARDDLQTVLHELTHWCDQVGTLWGRKFLRTVYEAYEVVERGESDGVEASYWKLVALHDAQRRFMHADYYRTVHEDPPDHDVDLRWRIAFTCGQEFTPHGKIDVSHPVLFVRFSDHDTDELITRQPLTVGALLETNAMWTEIRVAHETISSLRGDERDIAELDWKEYLLDYLYDPEGTLYTAPAHLVAYFAGVTDAALAYELASSLAHIALNLSDELFASLRPQDDLLRAWGERVEAFVVNRDPAFAFFVLARWGKKWDGGQVQDWVSAAIKAAGLPDIDALYASSKAQMEQDQADDLKTELIGAYQYLLAVGLEVFASRVTRKNAGLSVKTLAEGDFPLPPIFDANDDLIALGVQEFDTDKFNPKYMDKAERVLRKRTRNFLSACR